MNKVILVDKKDKARGFLKKEKAHTLKGRLHRAFSIFILNSKGELLIQKRSKYKKLWPLNYWTNSCCSHGQGKEEIIKTAQKKLKQELGFTTKLKLIDKFLYSFPYKNIGSEYELSYIFLGNYDGQVKPNKEEVADYKWIKLSDLEKEIKISPNNFTPWFKKEIKEFIKNKIL
ncbi:isopentenyl-diphosphate Delta-isomerase [Patescibacteria group bacterium]